MASAKHTRNIELTIFQYSKLLYDAFAGKNVLPSTVKGRITMNICFYLSYFLTEPNESISKHESNNYLQSLRHIIDPNIAEIIISFIVDKSNYLKWVQFKNMDNKNVHKYQQQVVYSHNDNIVDFSNDRTDYVNVRSTLLSGDIFAKYFINIYCLGKGDEMWLGIIEKDSYIPRKSVRTHSNGLFYYGGREYVIKRYGGTPQDECHGWGSSIDDCNHGGIQGKNQVIKHPIQSYSAGDWINFVIDFQHKQVTFYKNGIKQYTATKEYFPSADCYFMVELDDGVDKFYIEQAFNELLICKSCC